MTVTASTLKEAFPEFDGATDAHVTATIALATARCHSATWGDLRDQGIMYMSCDLLARSPFARDMRLVAKDGTTVYQETFDQLLAAATCGRR